MRTAQVKLDTSASKPLVTTATALGTNEVRKQQTSNYNQTGREKILTMTQNDQKPLSIVFSPSMSSQTKQTRTLPMQ